MDDNNTRRTQRAAAGLVQAKRTQHPNPDTMVIGPGGKILVLGRRTEATPDVPAFHKYNPSRRGGQRGGKGGSRTAQQPRVMSPAAAAAAAMSRGGGRGRGFLQGPLGFLSRIPLMNVIVTAVLVHRVWGFLMRRLFNEPARLGRGAGGRQGQIVVRRGQHADGEYDENDELDEQAEALLEQMKHASMLPTVLRASLPKPRHQNLAKRAAQQHHSRPRDYRTAHQLMHRGPAAPGAAGGRAGSSGAAMPGKRQAQHRALGKLEKMDLIVRQQVRAAMLAQQRQQAHELQQHLGPASLEAPPSGAPLALPAAGPSGQLQQPQGLHHQQPVTAGRQLALRPGPPGVGGAGGVLPLAPSPIPPPAFRPLPPELRARMQGTARAGAAARMGAAQAAAAPGLASSVDAGTSDVASRASGSGQKGAAGEGERADGEVPGGAEKGDVDSKIKISEEEDVEEIVRVSRIPRKGKALA